jgi:hypothetical protein
MGRRDRDRNRNRNRNRNKNKNRNRDRNNNRSRTIHIQHHKDRGDRGFWSFMEFGIPLIFWFIVVYGLIFAFNIDATNGIVSIVALIIIFYLSLISAKKLNKMYNRFSRWLNV